MNLSSTVLITCIGKSDPYTNSRETCKTGPTLSLILKFLPTHFIFFVSKDIEKENRLKIIQKAIKELYLIKEFQDPVYEIIQILDDSETFEYQETLKKVTNELRIRLSKFDKDNSKFIFSKTSGTPQYKSALEIFPNLYMEEYHFEIITKSDFGKGLSELELDKFSTYEIFNDIADETYTIKDSLSKTIIMNNEFNSQSIFSKLQILKELIKESEYNAAISILEKIFPYVTLGRNAEPEKNWLNGIYDKDTIGQVYKALKLARALLAFELSSGKNVREDAERFIVPEVKNFFDRYRGNTFKTKVELAYLNFEIFRKKSLHKETLLSFSILLERLRKENVKQQILGMNIFELNDQEHIAEGSVSTEFHEYFYDFIKRDECIELPKLSISKFNSDESIRSLTMPVLEAVAYFLYEIKEIKIDTYQFYQELKADESKLAHYKSLKDLRDKLAHDFIMITPSNLQALENLQELVKKTYPAICVNKSIYESLNQFIFKKLFSLNLN
jgi:hypothetical protein